MFFRRSEKKAKEDARKAVVEATKHVKEVKSRHEEVTKLSGALREARQRNHFADQIALIMGK